MNFVQSFKMAAKSLMSNKLRSILTMLGIIFGIAAVMALVSVVRGSAQRQREYYESMGTNKINVYADNYGLGGKDIAQELTDFCMENGDLVMGVTPNIQIWGREMKSQNRNTADNYDMGQAQIYMGSEQYSACNNFTVAQGRDISSLDIENYNRVVVLGAELKNYLFQYQDAVGEKLRIGQETFEVIGVYAAKDTGYMAYSSLDYMAVIPYSLIRYETDQYTRLNNFTVKARSGEQMTDAVLAITDFLGTVINRNNGGYFDVYPEGEYQAQQDEENMTMALILGSVAGLSLLVGGIGIMNIMLVTVKERTREIGIRKAIGGSRRSILIQFLIEASTVCVVGGIFGIVLGYLGTLVAGKLLLNMQLIPDPGLAFIAAGFSVVLGIIFGMYPAIKASGLQPVEALRAE